MWHKTIFGSKLIENFSHVCKMQYKIRASSEFLKSYPKKQLPNRRKFAHLLVTLLQNPPDKNIPVGKTKPPK
jgi:mRNA-degrading endonuclease RelE of RelBE toxin-antitoxin system